MLTACWLYRCEWKIQFAGIGRKGWIPHTCPLAQLAVSSLQHQCFTCKFAQVMVSQYAIWKIYTKINDSANKFWYFKIKKLNETIEVGLRMSHKWVKVSKCDRRRSFFIQIFINKEFIVPIHKRCVLFNVWLNLSRFLPFNYSMSSD